MITRTRGVVKIEQSTSDPRLRISCVRTSNARRRRVLFFALGSVPSDTRPSDTNKQGNRPGYRGNQKPKSSRTIGDHYTALSYGRAISERVKKLRSIHGPPTVYAMQR